jgi:ribose transport system permease protein
MSFSLSKSSNSAMKKKTKIQILLVVCLLIIYVILNISVSGRLLTLNNMKTIMVHAIFPCFLSWGMMFIFTGGLIDLSIGANVLLAANLGAICAMDFGMGYLGLIAITIISAVLLELLSVSCSVILKIPSWISGLGMALIFEAILTIYCQIRSKTEGSSSIYLVGFRGLGQMPLMPIIWVVGCIIAYILFNRSTLGLNIRAVGGDNGVARAMGISTKKTLLLGAIVGGVFIGVAAMIQISYTGKLSSNSGLGSLSLMFKSLASILLGMSLSRLVSVPIGVLISSVFLTSLFNVLTLLGVPSGTGQEICLGLIVILCGVISHWGYKGVVK